MLRPLRTLRVISLLAALVLLTGCQAMADQPRYDPLEASNFFVDGQSARPAVPGLASASALGT